jgi:hypothetical protein
VLARYLIRRPRMVGECSLRTRVERHLAILGESNLRTNPVSFFNFIRAFPSSATVRLLLLLYCAWDVKSGGRVLLAMSSNPMALRKGWLTMSEATPNIVNEKGGEECQSMVLAHPLHTYECGGTQVTGYIACHRTSSGHRLARTPWWTPITSARTLNAHLLALAHGARSIHG